jgi:hypothetical protein
MGRHKQRQEEGRAYKCPIIVVEEEEVCDEC